MHSVVYKSRVQKIGPTKAQQCDGLTVNEAKYNRYVYMQYIEKRTRSGDAVITGQIEKLGQGLGFCPDFTPDKIVPGCGHRTAPGRITRCGSRLCQAEGNIGVTHIITQCGLRGAQCIHRCELLIIVVELKTYNIIRGGGTGGAGGATAPPKVEGYYIVVI